MVGLSASAALASTGLLRATASRRAIAAGSAWLWTGAKVNGVMNKTDASLVCGRGLAAAKTMPTSKPTAALVTARRTRNIAPWREGRLETRTARMTRLLNSVRRGRTVSGLLIAASSWQVFPPASYVLSAGDIAARTWRCAGAVRKFPDHSHVDDQQQPMRTRLDPQGGQLTSREGTRACNVCSTGIARSPSASDIGAGSRHCVQGAQLAGRKTSHGQVDLSAGTGLAEVRFAVHSRHPVGCAEGRVTRVGNNSECQPCCRHDGRRGASKPPSTHSVPRQYGLRSRSTWHPRSGDHIR